MLGTTESYVRHTAARQRNCRRSSGTSGASMRTGMPLAEGSAWMEMPALFHRRRAQSARQRWRVSRPRDPVPRDGSGCAGSRVHCARGRGRQFRAGLASAVPQLPVRRRPHKGVVLENMGDCPVAYSAKSWRERSRAPTDCCAMSTRGIPKILCAREQQPDSLQLRLLGRYDFPPVRCATD